MIALKIDTMPKAITIYKQLRQENPDDVGLCISLAECASQAGDARLTKQSWQAADSLLPNNRFIQTQKTVAFHRNGHWAETIEQAQAVLATDSIPLLLRLVGDAFQFNNNRDSAVW